MPTRSSSARRRASSRGISFSALALAVAAPLGLAGCLSSGEDDSVVGAHEIEVLSIDRQARTITTREAYWYCEGETPVSETETYTEDYRIAGGKLYRWEEDYSCMTSVTAGTSTDIVGAWTAKPPKVGDGPVKDDAWCDEEAEGDIERINQAGRRLSVTEKISEERVSVSVAGEYCAAEGFAYHLTQFTSEEVVFSAQDCSSIRMTNSGNATARLESSVSGGKIAMKFVTGDKICNASLSLTDFEKQSCTDGGADAVFENCVVETGFFGARLFEKGAASEMPGRTAAARFRQAMKRR